MSDRELERGVSSSSNNSMFMSESVMKYRLDTRDVLFDIEMQLRGKQLVWVTLDGEVREEWQSVGKKKMNDEGIQSIISYLRSVLGPHTVQGNFKEEGYDDLICEIDMYLTENVMVNLHNWGMSIEDYNYILDTVVTTLRLFLSRTIDNKERESYAATMRSVESNRYEKSGGGWNPFGKS